MIIRLAMGLQQIHSKSNQWSICTGQGQCHCETGKVTAAPAESQRRLLAAFMNNKVPVNCLQK